MTAAIWHNRATGQPLTRSLIAYDSQCCCQLAAVTGDGLIAPAVAHGNGARGGRIE
jgi:hypothetical protein